MMTTVVCLGEKIYLHRGGGQFRRCKLCKSKLYSYEYYDDVYCEKCGRVGRI